MSDDECCIELRKKFESAFDLDQFAAGIVVYALLFALESKDFNAVAGSFGKMLLARTMLEVAKNV